MNSEIKSMPFSWNDNLSEVAIEDFQLIQKDVPYLTCQSIGMALAKLELLEKQGCKVDEAKEEVKKNDKGRSDYGIEGIMEIKKILGWIILIAILLGLFLAQTFVYMDECDVSFLCGVGLTIVTLVIIGVVVSLVELVMNWLIG